MPGCHPLLGSSSVINLGSPEHTRLGSPQYQHVGVFEASSLGIIGASSPGNAGGPSPGVTGAPACGVDRSTPAVSPGVASAARKLSLARIRPNTATNRLLKGVQMLMMAEGQGRENPAARPTGSTQDDN